MPRIASLHLQIPPTRPDHHAAVPLEICTRTVCPIPVKLTAGWLQCIRHSKTACLPVQAKVPRSNCSICAIRHQERRPRDAAVRAVHVRRAGSEQVGGGGSCECGCAVGGGRGVEAVSEGCTGILGHIRDHDNARCGFRTCCGCITLARYVTCDRRRSK